mgnify:CR=1 FL=1
MDVNNLYGGEEGLMKACGHELKGLMSYVDCRIRGLHFPLMVIIDYQGWRLIAESVLPLGIRPYAKMVAVIDSNYSI